MSDDGWEVVEMSDDELDEIDPTLTQRIMARHPDKYIASPDPVTGLINGQTYRQRR
jgi:hypothetical protein